MKFPNDIPVYGDTDYRGECPRESLEQVTLFRRLRQNYPQVGAIAIHPRNEGVRKKKQQVDREKAEGMTPGASDVIVPGSPAFVCEVKRRDHTKSEWQDEQIEYLRAALNAGAFACVALGADAAIEALEAWLASQARS